MNNTHFTTSGVIGALERASDRLAGNSAYRAVAYVGRIQRGEERPIKGWTWPLASAHLREAQTEKLISAIEAVARGERTFIPCHLILAPYAA